MSYGVPKYACVDCRTHTKRRWFHTPRCPVCAKDMVSIGSAYKVPPKDDDTGWESMRLRIRANQRPPQPFTFVSFGKYSRPRNGASLLAKIKETLRRKHGG